MLRVTFADRPTVQFIFLAYALIAVSANSRSADNLQALNERITALESVRLGDSEDTVSAKLQPAFARLPASRYVGAYPFTFMLPYTNRTVITEWQFKTGSEDQRGQIVFAVFSDSAKTNLVDALLFSANTLQPIVDGRYNRSLLAIKKGDSVQKLYLALGRVACDYLLSKEGKWTVRFDYWAYGGRDISITADAASGIITDVQDGTI
jgi:hypothetical protein